MGWGDIIKINLRDTSHVSLTILQRLHDAIFVRYTTAPVLSCPFVLNRTLISSFGVLPSGRSTLYYNTRDKQKHLSIERGITEFFSHPRNVRHR